ncbi:hypothetical protein DPMN_134394 [Dreissena polymorpha]|uniref:Uncharacterized protein n=1 Tax=Dreissena polymorpha TaxID=45954 RepID=A0A9D4FW29_DREPO|nr:hypothetical protein DPMN_134394 [Dreissena polymorpha]
MFGGKKQNRFQLSKRSSRAYIVFSIERKYRYAMTDLLKKRMARASTWLLPALPISYVKYPAEPGRAVIVCHRSLKPSGRYASCGPIITARPGTAVYYPLNNPSQTHTLVNSPNDCVPNDLNDAIRSERPKK